MLLKTLAAAFACALVLPLGQDPAAGDKLDAKVRQLLELNGAGQMGKQVMDQMLESFRGMPELPEGFIDMFQKLAKPQDLVEMTVPIYRKHCEERTLDAAIAFFASAEGKKLTAALPAITRESMAAGEKWGRELATKVLKELGK